MTFAELATDRAEKILPLLDDEMASHSVALDSIELAARLTWVIKEIRAIASVFVMKETQEMLAKVMFKMAKDLEMEERAIDATHKKPRITQ